MFRKKHKAKQAEVFPKSLAEYGYYIKPDGSIRSLQSALINDMVIQRIQQAPLNMVKASVPPNVELDSTTPHACIFMTKDALTTTDKLLVLVPGSQVNAGTWSRRIMCDENINEGSMLTTCYKAVKAGFEIIITNPNANYWSNDKAYIKRTDANCITIPGSDTPEEHVEHVFNHYLKTAPASRIAIMGQGWAGHLLGEQLNNNFDLFKDKVKAIALADSVHSRDLIEGDEKRVYLFEKVANWMTSAEDKKGEIIRDPRFGCTCISAGVEISDFALPTSLDDMFKFYRRQFDEETTSDEEGSVEDEFITDAARQAIDQEKLEELQEFVTVVDKDSAVDFD
ncbi:hypothetical protein NQZ79_g1671 [Umbelopsis isabellina]|nr:hypothetical protein NQZ79_g1671 [Umbelopsis isabellina]